MANSRLAILPGSFDPVTFGHLDLIQRAARLFDMVVVALLRNPAKRPLFSTDERMAMLRQSVAGLDNVEVDAFGGLLAEYARSRHAVALIRGLRGGSDFDAERQMAAMNRHLEPAIDTLFLAPSPEFAHISSTLVREIAVLGGSIEHLAPPPVRAAFQARREAGRTQKI